MTPQRLHIVGMYLFCTVVWGSSYFAVRQQIGPVRLEISLLYRLCIAAMIFVAIVAVTRRWRRLAVSDHLGIMAFGWCNMALGYLLLYQAASHMTSAFVVIIFSTKVVMTAVAVSLFLRTPLEKRVLQGGAIGLAGIVVLLWPQLSAASGHVSWVGLGLAMLGTIVTALGDVASARNSRAGVDPMQANVLGLVHAILLLAVLAGWFGWPLAYDPSVSYGASLVYLAVFGSVVAWVFYLHLVRELGPSRSGYMVALFPAVGATFSAAFEGLAITGELLIGLALAIVGNLVAMRRPASVQPGQAKIMKAA